MKITTDNYFDAAQALFWTCFDWHNGQWSTLYRVLCELEYRPGMGELGCEPETEAMDIYNELQALAEKDYKALESLAETMLADIKTAYEASHD